MMTLENQLEIAIEIALQAHKGQVDKAGMPYILHPLRIMNNVTLLEEKIVAVLHDVVEDSSITFDMLIDKGIDKRLVDSLRLLTHNKDVPYDSYINDIVTNRLATQIKLADLYDNSNLERLNHKTEEDYIRVEKYKKAIAFLEQYLNSNTMK